MNRDGFTLLAMGFTGQKALKFKLKYIGWFFVITRFSIFFSSFKFQKFLLEIFVIQIVQSEYPDYSIVEFNIY